MIRKTFIAVCILSALPALAAGADPSPRFLPITVAVDAGFQENPLWKGLVRRAVEAATADLASEVGFIFAVGEPRIWSPPASARTWEEVLARAKKEIGSEGGLTAVFLADRPLHLSETEDMGIAYLAEPTLIVLSPKTAVSRESLVDHLALFFRHELGHVFGVPHMAGRTVMNPRPQELGKEFDPLALDIIRANRGMDFQAEPPFEGSDLTVLRDVYLILDKRGEMETALLRGLGTALYRAQRDPEAREVLRAAVRRERRSEPACLDLARLAAAHGDMALLREILEGLEDAEVPPELLAVEGHLWLELKEYEKARAPLTGAIEHDPDHYEARFNRGLAWFQQGRFPEAIEDFQTALAIEPRPEVWFNLGLAYLRTEDRKGAAHAFQRYLDLVPEGGRSREARAFLENLR